VNERLAVGLEEGADGGFLAHALDVPGCAAAGASPAGAVASLQPALFAWLRLLASRGEPVPPAGAELELGVDEWIRTGARVSRGETRVLFAADLPPLAAEEAERLLHRLGDLRGRVLALLRRRPEALLETETAGGTTVRRVLEELARAQWWTLTRLGASPLGEVPERTLARLDTAMALTVDRLTSLEDADRGRLLEIDGEEWTPRKVVRRLLWLEWTLGGAALGALAGAPAGANTGGGG
jgi:predicted RNase H-like HicB family nuclease